MADNPTPSTSYQANPEKCNTCISNHKLSMNYSNIQYLVQIISDALLSDTTSPM